MNRHGRPGLTAGLFFLVVAGCATESAPPAVPFPAKSISTWYHELRSDPWAGHYLAIRPVDSPPRMVSQPPPGYPRQDLRAGIPGQALVAFVVGVDGAVREGRVLEATRPEFGEAALAAVETWLFRPAEKDGLPVPQLLVVPISFSPAHR